MPFLVLPALIPDIRAVYDVYFSAFTADPSGKRLLSILFPNTDFTSEDFRKAHTDGTLKWWHSSETQYTFKCVDAETGKVVGMTLCDVFVKPRTEGERQVPEVGWLTGQDKERAETVLMKLWRARERIWGGQSYIYIHAFAVDPEYQGRGAGSALIQATIDLGNSTNLPIYLESSPAAEPVYAKKGFRRIPADIAQVVHEAAVLGTDYDVEVPLMVRLPQGVYTKKIGDKTVGELWEEREEERKLQTSLEKAPLFKTLVQEMRP
ncbi:acyl-CoA N-acyltransferase [Cladorrhinum sp. PSN259]|nr:acyl-CoA N-acyltransferase [Cladorrhinum sp. PSN259]